AERASAPPDRHPGPRRLAEGQRPLDPSSRLPALAVSPGPGLSFLVRGMENREAPPKGVEPAKQKRPSRSGLALLTLATGVVGPTVDRIGVWVIVRAIRGSRNSAARTVPVSRLKRRALKPRR